MAGLDLVTPPAAEPVSVADAKAWLQVTATTDDDLIGSFVVAARMAAEADLKKSLVTTGWRYRIDGPFPWEIRLPIGPVPDMDGITISYVDTDGTTRTLDATVYRASPGETGVIRPGWGCVWPATQPISDAVTISFNAGYGAMPDDESDDPNPVPQAIRTAILLMVGSLYRASRKDFVLRSETVDGVGARQFSSPDVLRQATEGIAAPLLGPYRRYS